MAGYALALGRSFDLEPPTLERLEYAALLHDIGKIAIPRAILVKPGGLSDEEYTAIKQHPLRGAEIVARIPSLEDVVPYVRSHHEWFDGRGYCDGLSGDDIPMLARVLSVARRFRCNDNCTPVSPSEGP